MTKFITWLTAILVFLVTLGSFILSYNALREMALHNGIPERLSYIWPLLVDFSLIVFSLSVVVASLHNESTVRHWLLVGIYTITTCVFNVLHAPDILVAQVIAIIAPVTLFFTFESLMVQLKNSVKRSHLVHSINSLALTEQKHKDALSQVQSELEQVLTLSASTHNDYHLLHEKYDTLSQQVQALSQEDIMTTRRNKVLALTKEKKTQADIAKELGVSVATVRNDIKALNGKVKELA